MQRAAVAEFYANIMFGSPNDMPMAYPHQNYFYASVIKLNISYYVIPVAVKSLIEMWIFRAVSSCETEVTPKGMFMRPSLSVTV